MDTKYHQRLIKTYREQLVDSKIDQVYIDFYDSIRGFVDGKDRDKDVRFDFFTVIRLARQGKNAEALELMAYINDDIDGKA